MLFAMEILENGNIACVTSSYAEVNNKLIPIARENSKVVLHIY